VSTATASSKRFTARIPRRIQDTLEDAASLAGTPVNQFVIQAAYKEAQRMIECETRIRLSREETKRVFGLLEKPPKPTAAAKKAMAEYRKLVRVRD
jgi:uncharacterized protein (DUF1778 family)